MLLDTDAFSKVVMTARDREPQVADWRRRLTGRTIVIAAQTEGELRFGALSARWGPARLAGLEAQLARHATAPVTTEVVKAFAEVRAACRAAGHPLADKLHMGDAWVAATAIAHDLRLLAGDRIYRDVPGLRLLEDISR